MKFVLLLMVIRFSINNSGLCGTVAAVKFDSAAADEKTEALNETANAEEQRIPASLQITDDIAMENSFFRTRNILCIIAAVVLLSFILSAVLLK